ncbi:hypothetical protein RRK63_004115 [Vibrio fluvialis]|nr:hypothetical protein [Vibrio fluvialis]
MDFINVKPTNASALWQLQLELLAKAENLFGKRDQSKKIYQPSWDPEGPHIRYTPTKDGAFAELGDNAKSNWRLAVYHLAHETVHLLDQHGGQQTVLLEEGAAVRFSLDMIRMYGFDITGLPDGTSYQIALRLFDSLGDNPYQIAKNCRLSGGGFNAINSSVLNSENPDLSSDVISQLLSKPKMR